MQYNTLPKGSRELSLLLRVQGGLIQCHIVYKNTTFRLVKYLEASNDWLISLVEDHERRKKLHSAMKANKIFSNECMHNTQVEQHEGCATTIAAKKGKSIAKQNAFEQIS